MNKLFIPPALVAYSTILIVLFSFILPKYNLIVFPYNIEGIVVSIAGFFLMARTNMLFKKHKTTLAIEKSSHLINYGVFSKTRNPMYVGFFLLLLGFSICSMNIFSIGIPFIFIMIIRIFIIPKEENLMLDAFGNEYLEYKKKVRRLI